MKFYTPPSRKLAGSFLLNRPVNKCDMQRRVLHIHTEMCDILHRLTLRPGTFTRSHLHLSTPPHLHTSPLHLLHPRLSPSLPISPRLSPSPSQMPKPIEDPILAYAASAEINNLQVRVYIIFSVWREIYTLRNEYMHGHY